MLKFSSTKEAIQYLANYMGKKIKIAIISDNYFSTSGDLDRLEKDYFSIMKSLFSGSDNRESYKQKAWNKFLKLISNKISSKEIADIKESIENNEYISDIRDIIKNPSGEIKSAYKGFLNWRRFDKGKYDNEIKNSFKELIKEAKNIILKNNSKVKIENMMQYALDKFTESVLNHDFEVIDPDVYFGKHRGQLVPWFRNHLLNFHKMKFDKDKKTKRTEDGLDIKEKEAAELLAMIPKSFSIDSVEDRETLKEFVEFIKQNAKNSFLKNNAMLFLIKMISVNGSISKFKNDSFEEFKDDNVNVSKFYGATSELKSLLDKYLKQNKK